MEFFTYVLVIALVLLAAWSYQMAQRLNRLHIRTDSSLQALQEALDRRAAIVAATNPQTEHAATLASSIPLQNNTFAQRAEYERSIAQEIAQMGEPLPPRIVESQTRLQLAYRFYNDAVADTRALRTRPLVRILRLGGNAKLPEFFEFTEY